MKRVVIQNIRCIQHLEFILPSKGVHIITGENGTGKSTLFTCLNRICDGNAYRDFRSSQNLDEFTGSISYAVDEEIVTYTRRESGRWQPDSRGLDVFTQFGYPDIVHIATKNERIFVQDISRARRQVAAENWLIESLNTVLNTTKFNSMVKITVGDLRGRGDALGRRRNTAFALAKEDGSYYTERNFSFGEIVLLNLLYDIENVANGSLVLIDELEMALHPSAQIRLINKLKELSDEKRLTIIVSTHSSSIIKSQKHVILLEMNDGLITVIDKCPPAKAIGAIGMREDTMPDIIILVEDDMARSLVLTLIQKYIALTNGQNYLDIRVMCVGGFANTVNFYVDADNYIFYDNVYVVAFLDKDVETDIIDFAQYGNQTTIRQFEANRDRMRFLPYTPEVLLCKTFKEKRSQLIRKLRNDYMNQQIDYNIPSDIDFEYYEQPIGTFASQEDYNNCVSQRGAFRGLCKRYAEEIATKLSNDVNRQITEIYRFVFQFAIDEMEGTEMNVREILGAVMNRR